MSSGSPPSSHSFLPRDPALAAARGTVRDALGGLRNLVQLLKSIRVGPKALTTVIPDVLGSCAALNQALVTLVAGLSQRIAEPELKPLVDFLFPKLHELEQALETARAAAMTAKTRLVLERSLSPLSADLDAARELMDLLEEAAWGPAMHVAFVDLVVEALDSGRKHGKDAAPIAVTFSEPPRGAELRINARAAIRLLPLAVSQIASRPGVKPHIALECTDDGNCVLTLSSAPGTGTLYKTARQHIITASLPCIEIAARLLDAQVTSDARTTLALAWHAEN